LRARCLVFVALAAAFGCSSRSSSSGAAASVAVSGVTSGSAPTPTGAISSGTTATTTSRATAPATPADLARLHAPAFRFNAWVPNDSSPHNKSEDYFPMSVARFLDEIASGSARVATKEAEGATPGINEVQSFSSKVVVDEDKIDGYPKLMAGDEPGTSPIYAHVYEDTSRKVKNPDGSGEDYFFIEYWVFYPQDVAKIRVTALTLRFGGHRSDWEHLTVGAALVYGPGGAFLRSEVRQGLYYGHNDKFAVEKSELELVDDQGRTDPQGTHVVVYIALGKHAAYPEPGVWRNRFGAPPLVGEDDVFRGNGVEWRAWTTPVHDLEGPPTPEFTPPVFALLLSTKLATTGLVDWREYKGHWGPDKAVPLIPITASPKGPRAKPSEYGSGDKSSDRWSDVKRSHASELTLARSPAIVPPPVPRRR
jgi:hypothetical protein